MTLSPNSARPRVFMAALVCLLVATAATAAAQERAVPPRRGIITPASSNVINMVVVKVNGDAILLTDLEETELNQLAILRQQLPEDEIQAQLPQMRQGFLAGLIDERMMRQRADELGITADANMVDSAIRNLREQNGFASDDELIAELAAFGMTMEDLREQTRNTLRQRQLVQQEVNRSVFVSETEIVQYYNDHAEEFRAPERVRLRQLIFITAGGDPTALRQQAEAALAELRGGADYRTVADKYTNATSAGGEETFVSVNELNAALAGAVPAIRVGEYADLVESQFGFHIVSVLERQGATIAALADVQQNIRNRLSSEKSQRAIEEYLVGLRNRTDLKIFDPRFATIEEAWKAPPEQQAEAQ